MRGIYINEDQINRRLKTHPWQQINMDNSEENIALYSELVTDVLIVRLKKLLDGKFLLGTSVGFQNEVVKSSWISLAELVSKEISLVEDFEPGEISVGKIFTRYSTDVGTWGFFISDNLDNGAGYSYKYSDPEKFFQVLETLKSKRLPFLMNRDHSHSCTTSCYHCIRNYNNRFEHNSLDWRLGIDLLHCFLDEKFVPSLNNPWWSSYVQEILPEKLKNISNLDFKVTVDEEKRVYLRNGENFCILPVHPLLHMEHSGNAFLKEEFLEDVEADGGGILNVFEFERKPWLSIQKLTGGK
jgi:hypothetical protein